VPKKPFIAKQDVQGSYNAQASFGATATVNHIHFDVNKDTSQGALTQVLKTLQAVVGGSDLPESDVARERDLIVLGPPEPPAPRIARQDLEALCSGALLKGKPIALYGESGSGRSELARSATANSVHLLWIDFHANRHLRASSVLETALSSRITGRKKAAKEFGALLRELPPGLTVVLENIDESAQDPEFSTRLAQVAHAAAPSRLTLICSSIHLLPGTLQPLFEHIQVLRYDDSDIKETLEIYGAPPTVNQDRFRGVVMGLTQGQPELTILLVQFLAQRRWVLSDDVWLGLVEQTFAVDLKGETQRRLLSTEEPHTLELLYRLTSLMRPFSEKEALEIGRIEPEIPHVMQRLASLYGRWLQRAGDKGWRTSPLLSGLGDENLIRSVKTQVHKSVAQWILARKKLNQLNTSEAITHLLLAEKFNEAAGIFLHALYSLMNAGPDVEPGNLLSLWKGLPLPPQMSLGLRIGIRGMQAAIAIQRGNEYSAELADLRKLTMSLTQDFEFMTAFAALSGIALQLLAKRPVEALPFISQASVRQVQIVDPRVLDSFRGHASSEMFWAAAMKICDREGIRQWMHEVNTLTGEQRSALVEAAFAPESACRMFDALWMGEQELAEKERNWPSLISLVEEFEAVATPWNSSLISGCLLRARQAVRIVHLGEVEEAIQEADAFFANHTGPHAAAGRFLVSHGTGLWLTDIDRWEDASKWLARACEYQADHLALHRQQNYLRYGHALYRNGTPESAPFHEAIRLAETDNSLTPINEIRARAELATLLWLTGKREDLFEQWTLVVRKTLATRDESKRWKQVYVLVANNTAYWGNRMAQVTGTPGGMIQTPELGMFITEYADLSDRYSDKILFVLPGNMTWFAERLGKFKDAAEWARLTVDTAEEISHSNVGKGFLLQAIPYAVLTGDYREAVACAAAAIRGLSAEDPIEFPEAVLRDNPLLTRPRVKPLEPVRSETNAIVMGLLPSLIAITAEGFADRAAADRHLDQLLEACSFQRDLGGAPAAWDAVRSVLETVRAGSLKYADFSNEEKKDGDLIGETARLLKSFALLGLSNDETISILRAQVTWTVWLTSSFASFHGLGTVITPLIAKAWSAYIRQNGFYFQRPEKLIKSIEECAERGELGRLYIEITDNFGASIPQSWRDGLLKATFNVVPSRA
jgi:hypothetical protein